MQVSHYLHSEVASAAATAALLPHLLPAAGTQATTAHAWHLFQTLPEELQADLTYHQKADDGVNNANSYNSSSNPVFHLLVFMVPLKEMKFGPEPLPFFLK